ncbi:dihydroorotase [Desulforhopalus singaporensis]|uniref:Allantoinase n=1 Tax=Desulforhopalus singaporensis TaxID=91360 RepID=A0A1H0VM82_9BACT|nr:amidohydrolase family protein [Desulforhopalus singaporensis]SDP79315.1 allantoinase [Desulforhopalus singaporensis]
MKLYDILIQGNIVTRDEIIHDGYVAVSGETIAAVGRGELPQAQKIYDERGSFVMPGGIDSQVHSRSQKDREGFAWSTRSAASGGITTIVDMPYDDGNMICNGEQFRAKIANAEQNARVDVALYATIAPEEGTLRIKELVEAGAAGFKFSTFGTDPKRFPRIPSYLLFECFREIGKYQLVAGVHNENDEAVNYFVDKVKKSGLTDWTAHALSRPRITETLAMAEIYELAAETGCRGHVVHCSVGRGYEMCAAYRSQNADTTVEACIHYLILNHEEHGPKLKGLGKINPPIRPKAEVEAIWKHLQKGNVTVVSTDHVSWSLDRKSDPDMLKNASGAPGLEVLYPLLLTGCKQHDVSLVKAASVIAENPARLFNLHDRKGVLEVGKDADISIFRESPYEYNPRKSGNNISDWSPYEGMTLDFKLSKSFLRGELICDDGLVLSRQGNGRFLKPVLGK